MNEKQTYHYFYKITNLINGHYYYGIHSTHDLNDGYMGSGVRLNKAYKKYGIENFRKEILKTFDTRKEASDYETEVVTESLVKNNDCYNSIVGGLLCDKFEKLLVFNVQENIWQLVHHDYYNTHKNEFRHPTSGYNVIFIDGKYQLIDNKKFNELKSQGIKLQTPTSDKVTVKDKNGCYYYVPINDNRYLNGELVPIWKGWVHSDKTKEKIRQTCKLNHHQQGVKNSQYGTCWVYNEKGNMKINKTELEKYLKEGYQQGRKIILANDKVSFLNKNEIIKLRNEGKTWKEIYQLMNVSESTMYKFRRRNKDIN